MSKKNNLNFDNLDCETFTSKLYNLDYIMSTTIQIMASQAYGPQVINVRTLVDTAQVYDKLTWAFLCQREPKLVGSVWAYPCSAGGGTSLDNQLTPMGRGLLRVAEASGQKCCQS
jgi:hypothetical protein